MSSLLEIGLANALLAALLAIPAILIGRLGRRPALAHLLWLLVLVKLLTPPLFRYPVPLPDAPAFTYYLGQAAAPELPFVPGPSAPPTTWPEVGEDASLASGLVVFDVETAVAGAEQARTSSLVIPTDGVGTRTLAILAVWLMGAVLFLVITGRRVLAFHRLLGYSRPAPPELQERARRLADRLNLPRCPEVRTVPGAVSPLVWALGRRARLVLPSGLLAKLAPEQQDTLMAHELAHVGRHDHWVRWIELAATSLYWWHPVAWWARHEIQRLEEECCDAWVVWALPRAARDYAQALLETVNFLTDVRPVLPPAASGLGYVHQLKRRLNMILRERLCHRLSVPAILGVLVLALVVLPVGLQQAGARDNDEPELVPVLAGNQGLVEVIATLDDEEEDKDAPEGDRTRQMKRRLRALEERMDRLLKSLDKSGTTPDAAGRKGATGAEFLRQRGAVDRARAAEAAAQAAEAEARARAAEAEAKAKAAIKGLKEKIEAKGSKKAQGTGDPNAKEFRTIIERTINPERMKAMEREIQEAVKKAVDPAQLKDLERQIDAAVKRAIDPKQMEAMGREIEAAVKKAIDPKKMEEMGRKIEEATRKGIDPVRMKAMQLHLEEAVRRSAEVREREAQIRQRITTSPGGSRSSATGASGRGDADLEKRLERLEEKMERVIHALEKSSKSTR